MNCPFCNNKSDDERVLEVGSRVYVMLSDPRLIPGHVLVIPKRHVEKLSELDSEEIRELMQTTARFQEKITSTLATGCDVQQHYRPFQDEEERVKHLHIHLQPKDLYAELYKKFQDLQRDVFRMLNPKEKENLSTETNHSSEKNSSKL